MLVACRAISMISDLFEINFVIWEFLGSFGDFWELLGIFGKICGDLPSLQEITGFYWSFIFLLFLTLIT
jgi:hypothetical protein